MLLYFEVQNFKLFQDKVSFSLMANKKIDVKQEWLLPPTYSFFEGHPVLRSAAIYGANATGKSSLLEALSTIQSVVTRGKDRKTGLFNQIIPFKKNPDTVNQPTEFFLGIAIKGVRHEYSLLLDQGRVHKESLFYYPNTGRQLCFRRDRSVGDDIRKQYKFGKGMGRSNELFGLAAAAGEETFLFAGKDYGTFKNVYNWFRNTLGIIDEDHGPDEMFTLEYATKYNHMDKVIDFLQKADFPIYDIDIKDKKLTKADLEGSPFSEELKKKILESEMMGKIVHTIHKTPFGDIQFYLSEESEGTQKFLSLVGPIIEAEDHEGVIVIDELERSLHPTLVQEIIERFRRTSCSCQLIFTTHNTQLLSSRAFRKDQIWIMDKDKKTGIGALYSLNDFSDIRDSWDLGKAYLQGRFGGVPFVNLSREGKPCFAPEVSDNV